MFLRRQFVLTLGLMPITFGVWYAAGTLFAAPAVWLCNAILSEAYSALIDSVRLGGVDMITKLTIGESGGCLLYTSPSPRD